ncbi:MAG TPA: methyltransferase domain-containing protein [Phycisphaerae bacterium]|nr:methyltransferase domain-containing protein [Phycisphaerae bacterium]
MTEANHLPVREGYDRWSEVYDTDGNPLFVLEEPIVRRWLSDVGGRRVADIGCGTGRHTRWLVEAGASVVALDLSTGMMQRAVEKIGRGRVLFCRHALPTPLPLADGSCDHVLFALVGEHVEQLTEAFADFRRVLVPGGSVIMTALHPAMNLAGLTARFWDPHDGSEVRVSAFEPTMSDYLMAVLKAGLEVTEIVERKADEETARVAPRAAKYLGWPMLLAVRAVKRR